MKKAVLTMSVLDGNFGVCRLAVASKIPEWALESDFYSITKTSDELSIVCPEAAVPGNVICDRGWKGLKVAGPLDFGLTGILAGISAVLAGKEVSIFAVSTYDTDYILVRKKYLETAVEALEGAGYIILS
ncbi:hypothetical protein MSMTP_2073 [Methanosarcina sp. MTP4]|uniref:ACT domain-containing protein n=1 Tax=Methanosarcina sp. MTP4 TaxID=1434100 RepID=UPI000615DCFB|nr:ACT domain-containing protein [Methanosarcina sp. MTP4]AKB25542.1 hypothetical protein MSMTP_2073 [Methanosarcina sp. MTP4]